MRSGVGGSLTKTTKALLYQVQTLAQKFLARAILTRFTVRIHAGLISEAGPWIKIWYLLRGLDIEGSGYWSGDLSTICQLLATSSSTIRQWLREGLRAGAIRRWRVRGQRLSVALTSLHNLCLSLKLGNLGWGATAEIFLGDLPQIRPLATAIIAQREQQLSRFAAWRSLPTQELRKTYRLPQPEEFFTWEPRRLSNTLPTKGSIRCVIHVGKRRLFVSKGFIPFGASQNAIAYERNKSDRTVRRHLGHIGLRRRQICQAKAAYGMIQDALRWDSPGIAPEPDIKLKSHPNGCHTLTEPSGKVGKPHTAIVSRERFFTYQERHYIYRCNVYEPVFKLCSMRRSILNYKRLLEKGGCRGG